MRVRHDADGVEFDGVHKEEGVYRINYAGGCLEFNQEEWIKFLTSVLAVYQMEGGKQ